jgi:hypothetical protein
MIDPRKRAEEEIAEIMSDTPRRIEEKAVPLPAVRGTVPKKRKNVKPKFQGHYKPLCDRCGYGRDACLSPNSSVTRRSPTGKYKSACPWFEDEKSMYKGFNTFRA